MKIVQEQATNKKLKQLKPVSQVIFRALMEESYGPTYTGQIVDFLLEAQDVWKNEHPSRAYEQPGSYYLGRTYQILEEEKTISPTGRILNPQAFAAPKCVDGQLCRPKGFAPINYSTTAEFKKLAQMFGPVKTMIQRNR